MDLRPSENVVVRHIDIRDVRVEGGARGVEPIGLPEEWIRNATLENLEIDAEDGVRCTRIRGLTLADGNIRLDDSVPEGRISFEDGASEEVVSRVS